MKLTIPLWLKAILIGFLILEVGTKIWSLVAVSNINFLPHIPWSFPLILGILWLIWNYLNGKWWPGSTQAKRHLWMRASRIAIEKRKWTWISAVLLGLTLLCFMVISTKLVDFQAGQLGQIERISVYPVWTIIALILGTSIVAGVMEEIALRGYMQKPLEIKYGPLAAILVVAFVFTLLHLPNATISPLLIPIFFIGSIGWGILAYLSNSIIPGVVVHAAIDIISFMWVWQNMDKAKALSAESVLENGMNTSFIILLLITVSLCLSLAYAFYQLSKVSTTSQLELNPN